MIGIISALEEELKRFKDKASVEQVIRQAGIDFHIAELSGQKVVLLHSGVGKVNAAVAAQVLIDRFGVNSVILSGLAGGVVPYLNAGDIVVTNLVAQYDINPNAFGRRPDAIPDLARLIEADPRLVRAAVDGFEETVKKRTHNRQLVVGTIATGDTLVTDPAGIRWLQREFGAIAADMEGGAIGQVCQNNRIPFVVIRVISDIADQKAAPEFVMPLDEASELSYIIVDRMLRILAESAPTTDAVSVLSN
ncbi:MAG: 5'-methylthioadenosine/adenosylhomocysteine nucleosidase [Candidatus Zixiibacteriota bacterium]|nr:MAG: 5'-methylthioadenosine/adenosylhomocysteine nucleosidase [candidate division Zixibacteria bacterium]